MGQASRIDFCCFALPLINFGAYSLCIEFAVIALCVAILAVAPPQIVATMGALPGDFSKIIVCVLAIIILLWQVVGIVSIKREATRLYRIYIRVNFILTLLTILATLVFFVVSAARHSAAVTACTAAYGATPAGSQSIGTSDLTNVGTKICDIFIWVQIGFMGLLLVLIGLTQLYMCAVQRAYGKEMRHAERNVKSQRAGDEIPLATRDSGVWDAPAERAGYTDAMDNDGYNPRNGHSKSPSKARDSAYPSY